jgi:hypothetical protein
MVFGSGGFFDDSASNPFAILGNSRNGLGDHWHIAAGTEKNHQNLPAVVYRAKPLGPIVGISRTSQCEIKSKSA